MDNQAHVKWLARLGTLFFWGNILVIVVGMFRGDITVFILNVPSAAVVFYARRYMLRMAELREKQRPPRTTDLRKVGD